MTTIDVILIKRSGQWHRRLATLLQNGLRAAVLAYNRRGTRKALDRLDDRALKDIGLTHGPFGYERLP